MPTSPLICNSKIGEIDLGLFVLGLGVWLDEQVSAIENLAKSSLFQTWEKC